MLPAGYLYKRVVAAPEWLAAAPGTDVYSLSGCVSEGFADYIPYWRHNGYWLFDAPDIIETLAAEKAIDLSALTLFYYEVFEQQFDEETRTWTPFEAETSFPTAVQPPSGARLEGYDVVTFSAGSSPECSPLSCNGLAAEASANRHCLLDSFERAKSALEEGVFDGSEPGPFRIFAVHTLPDRSPTKAHPQGRRPA